MSRRTLALLLFVAHSALAAQLVVSQDGGGDFNGRDEKPIAAAIAKARSLGGGEILIGAGTYQIAAGLKLADAKNIRFRGEPGTVLKLPALQYAETSAAAAVGEIALAVRFQQGFSPGMRIRVMAPGEVDSFSKKQKPNFFVRLATIEGDKLLLEKPLAFPVPVGTRIINEEGQNLFELRGSCENISFRDLTLDGGRVSKDPAISGHERLCGFFVSAPFSYTDGPTKPPAKRIEIRDCAIRNFFGRGVAFYSVSEGLVANCVIENTVDEAIDFDHFAVSCRAIDNNVARCGLGVELNDANDCWVARNRFVECNTGINVWRWCKMPDLNTRNHIVDNLFLGMKANGIQFAGDTALNVARGNIIKDSARNGISVSGARAIVSENLVVGTGLHGIAVSGQHNEISRNRILDAATASAGKSDGILLGGANNRALDNFVGAQSGKPSFRKAIANEGKDNVVRDVIAE